MLRSAFDYRRRLRESRAYALVVTWLTFVAGHPWVDACRTAWLYAFAFLVGDHFEDERVTFSKKRLTVNDAYRDRLLAPEIADLVDLCDALQLSIPQRRAFFRCFLHLDYMRRAGVSRSELLRYCGLRDTPAARYLLPSDGAFAVAASAHRSDEFRTQRWDILQVLALMVSLCTMEPSTVVDACIQEIVARASAAVESFDTPGEEDVERDEERTPMPRHNRVAREIDACLIFSRGVPSPVERSLAAFLCRLCSDLQHANVDFAAIYGEGIAGIITHFPVLLSPCVWIQRVVQRRVMGETTWRKLASRRAELQLAGLGLGFGSAAEIVAAATVHGHHRQRQAPSTTTLPHGLVDADVERAQGSLSTPRKILPVEYHASSSEVTRLHHPFAAIQNEDDAWRATADSVLASMFVWQQCDVDEEQQTTFTTRDAVVLFEQTHQKIQSGALSHASVTTIQRKLIREYGYQFMAFAFAKSSIHETSGELVWTPSVKKDLRRATQRHRKADEGLPLVEDKAVYWKEFTDPVLKRVFYHNIRTGESRWDMPSTVVAKRRKKRKNSPTKAPVRDRNFL